MVAENIVNTNEITKFTKITKFWFYGRAEWQTGNVIGVNCEDSQRVKWHKQ